MMKYRVRCTLEAGKSASSVTVGGAGPQILPKIIKAEQFKRMRRQFERPIALMANIFMHIYLLYRTADVRKVSVRDQL
jgi:hypothetical protein